MRVAVRIGFKQHCRNKKETIVTNKKKDFKNQTCAPGRIHPSPHFKKKNEHHNIDTTVPAATPPACFDFYLWSSHRSSSTTRDRNTTPGVTDAFAHGFILAAQIYFKNRYVTSNEVG